MTTTTTPVHSFFAAFSNGDLDGIVATFDPTAEITAVRSETRPGDDIHGTFHGAAGVRTFIGKLGAAFDTQAFAVEDIISNGDVAFANGTFTHKVKATGKLFASAWALRCKLRDGKIASFHFYEDSAAFVEANR